MSLRANTSATLQILIALLRENGLLLLELLQPLHALLLLVAVCARGAAGVAKVLGGRQRVVRLLVGEAAGGVVVLLRGGQDVVGGLGGLVDALRLGAGAVERPEVVERRAWSGSNAAKSVSLAGPDAKTTAARWDLR